MVRLPEADTLISFLAAGLAGVISLVDGGWFRRALADLIWTLRQSLASFAEARMNIPFATSLVDHHPGYLHRRSSLITGFIVGITLAAVAGLLAACATIDGTSTPFIGAPHAAPTDPARVALLDEPPTRAHDALGEVVVEASTQPPPAVEQIEGRLRGEAAKLGADAVVIVMDRVVPTGYYAAGPGGPVVDTVFGRRIVGVAIKYRT